MATKHSYLLALLFGFLAPIGLFALRAQALSITTLPVEQKGDFVVEPAKQEVFLNPGDTVTKDILVTNRNAQPITFDISVEDFEGSDDPNQPVVLLGDERGPYSLKDFMKPEVSSVTLNFGEQASIPVTISIPKDSEPGGYYGAVIIANEPNDLNSASSTSVMGGARIVSRIGSLFLVRVNGPAKEEGTITDFRPLGPSSVFYQSPPTGFEIAFKNTGSVHLVPHGLITINNMLGTAIGSVPVDAYFALPGSTRYRDVDWSSPGFLLGRYTANLSFYPGYGSDNVERTIVFWVLPWKIILAVVLGVILLVALIYYIATRFEFRRKS